jgi:hypothetical protein
MLLVKNKENLPSDKKEFSQYFWFTFCWVLSLVQQKLLLLPSAEKKEVHN